MCDVFAINQTHKFKFPQEKHNIKLEKLVLIIFLLITIKTWLYIFTFDIIHILHNRRGYA